jgi:hypothetical protein
MEVGAILGLHGLEAIRDAYNGWHIGVFELRQGCRTSVVALRAAQLFVPLIGHWRPLFRGTLGQRADTPMVKTEHLDQFKTGHSSEKLRSEVF